MIILYEPDVGHEKSLQISEQGRKTAVKSAKSECFTIKSLFNIVNLNLVKFLLLCDKRVMLSHWYWLILSLVVIPMYTCKLVFVDITIQDNIH